MKELAEANAYEIMNEHESLTWLCLFMVGAMGDHHDLSAIYGTMRMNPPEKTMFLNTWCTNKRRRLK